MSFKPTCSLSSFTFIKRLFSSSSLSAIRVVSHTAFPSNKKQTGSHMFHQAIETRGQLYLRHFTAPSRLCRTREMDHQCGVAVHPGGCFHQSARSLCREMTRGGGGGALTFLPVRSSLWGPRTEDRGPGRLSDRQENSAPGGLRQILWGRFLQLKKLVFKGLIKCILLLQKSNPSSCVVATEMTN